MPKRRQVRRAYIEYQPNLQHPVAPIRLGVIAEEDTNDYRHVVLVGRVPNSSVAGLDLDALWGPFKAALTDWFEILSKNVVAAMDELPGNGPVVDHLAPQWRSNVYIRAPESLEFATEGETLMRRTTRWYETYVGERFREPPKPRRPKSKRVQNIVPIARIERVVPMRHASYRLAAGGACGI